MFITILEAIFGNKYVLTFLAMLGLGGYIWYQGYEDKSKQVAAQQERAEVAEKVVAQLVTQRDEEHDAAMKQQEVKIQTVYQQVTKDVIKTIEKPIYSNVCFDADGLRDANAALTNTLPSPQGSVGKVSELNSIDGGDWWSGPAEVSGSIEDILPVRNDAQQSG